MIPDIQLQLKAVVKSLKDNVLPAVDPQNELAQQQIQLSLATLNMILNNLPLIHSVLREDINQHLKMAGEIQLALGNADGKATLTRMISTTEQVLQDPGQGFTQLQHAARALRSTLGEVISTGNDEAEAVEKIVLAHCDASLLLGRALNKPTGFEPPGELPDVPALLARPRA